MQFSDLYNRAKNFCFVVLMMKQIMGDQGAVVTSCVSEIDCAIECMYKNCTSFGFNKTLSRCRIYFQEYQGSDNGSVIWHKCNSKAKMLDDVASADVELRSTSFEKDLCEPSDKQGYPLDCLDVDETITADKVYTIYPGPLYPCDVQCTVVENEKWTIIQRREDGSEDFYLNWASYKTGFGNRHSEYWIGNEALYLLTSKASYQLLIQLEDFQNETRFAVYDTFSVANETSSYKITVTGFSGTAGDSMAYHNGQLFTTKDRDNDKNSLQNCARQYHGAWWYNACHFSNLNGKYLSGIHTSFGDGITWNTWRGYHYSYKISRMLIRRK